MESGGKQMRRKHAKTNPLLGNTIQLKEEKLPDYVYVSRLSPLCKSILVIVLSYLVLLALVMLFFILNAFTCGLDAPEHRLRMRGSAGPISQEGLNWE